MLFDAEGRPPSDGYRAAGEALVHHIQNRTSTFQCIRLKQAAMIR